MIFLKVNVVMQLIFVGLLAKIRAASSEDCVFVPPNSYDVTAP